MKMPELWTDGIFEIDVEVAGRVECQGTEWEVGSARIRNSEYLYVFREVTKPETYFFLATRSWEGGMKVLLQPMVGHEVQTLAIWRESLKLSLELGAWGRMIWFDEQGRIEPSVTGAQWELFLLSDGRSGWSKVSDTYALEMFYPFEHEVNCSLLPEARMSQLVDWVIRLLSEPSDCQFAFLFAHMSEREKIQIAFDWRRGNVEEFERVCLWIGWLAVAWNEPWEGQKLSVSIFLDDFGDIFIASDSRPGFAILPNCSSAKELWDWALEINRPRMRPEFLERKSVAAWGLPCITVWISEPNDHERVEALVSLREWAAKADVEAELMEMLNLDHA